MDGVNLVPKGTQCKYKTKRYSQWGKDGISFEIDAQGYYVVDAFVSGDTMEKGLSLVALDNPEICLLTARADVRCNADRADILSGVITAPGERPTGAPSPTCPY